MIYRTHLRIVLLILFCMIVGGKTHAASLQSSTSAPKDTTQQKKNSSVQGYTPLLSLANQQLLQQRFDVDTINNYLFYPFTKENAPDAYYVLGFVRPSGEQLFNCYIGKVEHILRPRNYKGYVILTSYIYPAKQPIEDEPDEDSTMRDFKYLQFSDIKRDFMYGTHCNMSYYDIRELGSMLHNYGRETAQKMANARVMVSYPFSLRDAKFEDLYTRGRKLILTDGKYTLEFYYLMTNKGSLIFDTEILDDLKGVFQLGKP